MVKLTNEIGKGALKLHRESLVVDAHCDVLQFLFPGRRDVTRFDSRIKDGLGRRSEEGHVDIPRMIEGGVDCQVFAVFTAFKPYPSRPLSAALQMIDIFHSECEKNSDKIVPVVNHDEILKAHQGGKIAAMLSIEGAEVIEANLGVLRMLYRMGVRMMSLTWNWRNELADGVGEKQSKGGLSDLGVKVAKEMEKLGMVIDVSHLSDSSFWDLIEVARTPIMASHSNCRAICPVPRNLTDDQIKAIAETDGVVGMNFASSFVHREKATLERLVDHIDHVVQLVGVEHVGLGSDFDGITFTPEGLEDVTKIPNITKTLVSRGYPDEDIKKILGENHLRVFKKVLG